MVAECSKPGFVASSEDERVTCLRQTSTDGASNASAGAGHKDCSVLIRHADLLANADTSARGFLVKVPHCHRDVPAHHP